MNKMGIRAGGEKGGGEGGGSVGWNERNKDKK